MKRKWVKGVVAAGVIGCLLAGCASAKPAHLDGLDKLGAIEVVTREEGSGTRSTFAEKTGIVDDATGMDQTTKDSVAAAGNEDVLQKVEKDPNAIGYISSAIAGQSDQVHEVTLTKKNLSRNFYLTYTGKLSDAEEDFIRYIRSAGQNIVADTYTPVAKSATFLSDKAKGKIVIGGSTSVAPLMKTLAETYQTLNPNVKIEIRETDSQNGLSGAMEGTYDLGMSSRELKSYEEELLTKVKIAQDNIEAESSGGKDEKNPCPAYKKSDSWCTCRCFDDRGVTEQQCNNGYDDRLCQRRTDVAATGDLHYSRCQYRYDHDGADYCI